MTTTPPISDEEQRHHHLQDGHHLHTTPTLGSQMEPIYLLYDERMLLHRPIDWIEPAVFPEFVDEINDEDYPMENPERLRVIFERLLQLESRLLQASSSGKPSTTSKTKTPIFKRLKCEMATKQQILLAHRPEYYERLEATQYYSTSELKELSFSSRQFDVYFNSETFQAARLAAGGLLSCVDAVCDSSDGGGDSHNDNNINNKAKKSVALVRPPGHHACQSQEMGFCFINSVVVAAKYALATKPHVKKVVILDWDVHDGNGTADETIRDDNIFRIDLHRYNRREGFYPYTGAPNEVGSGTAKGLNCNIAWSQGGMRNTEYAAAFYELVLPLLVAYKPDLLIISCGLDAAMGDLLGGCELTPGFFHAMTRATIEATNCPVVCALEGGYSMQVIPNCMEAVTLGMLNCPYTMHSSPHSYCGGAAVENPDLDQGYQKWPSDALGRARKTLSKYYIREASHLLLSSAVDDINTSIKIFKNIDRWAHSVLLRPIIGPSRPMNSMVNTKGFGDGKPGRVGKKTKKRQLGWSNIAGHNGNGGQPFHKRPRMYLWWGSEDWHYSQSRYISN